MTLQQTLLGILFKNPLLTSAGKWSWHLPHVKEAIEEGAGGITLKSFSTIERKGHPDPTVIHTDHYTLNAVGLPSEGFEAVKKEFGAFLKKKSVPVILSIFGDTIERFAEAAEVFSTLKVDAIELNISCPNVADDHGRPFSYLPATAAAAVKAAKNAAPTMKYFAKLSPNVPNIPEIALACAEAGCDGFTLINTLGPGMAIDLKTRRPMLSNKTGGVSGPAIKPVAVRCIADVYKATEGKLPIIGTGGVSSGADAIELMMAGASLIGIGTAILTEGYGIFGRVTKEMEKWCKGEGVKSIEELVGAMHR